MKSGFSQRLAAASGALLLGAGAAALWFSADRGNADAVTPRMAAADASLAADLSTDLQADEALLDPPGAAPAKSREEQRFARTDRDDDGRITQAEYLQVRRRNYDKLDSNGDGRLSFEEYAGKAIDRFAKADANGDGLLFAAEFATTATKRTVRQTASAEGCRCPQQQLAASSEEPSQD